MSLARGLWARPCSQLTSLRLLAVAAVPASAASVERAGKQPDHATPKFARGEVVELECVRMGWSDEGARVRPESWLMICKIQ